MRKRKKRNNITTDYGMKTPERYRAIKQIRVAEFKPQTAEGEMQVHLLIDASGIRDTLVFRFQSPDSLADIIELLNFYRNRVWPDAEPLDMKKDFVKEMQEAMNAKSKK